MLYTPNFRIAAALIAASLLAVACGTTDSAKTSTQPAPDVQYQDAGQFLPPKPTTSTCNPCNSSLQCNGADDKDAKCVVYGDEGAFCGGSCKADADCTQGYSCKDVKTVEKADAKQCVRAKAAGDTGTYGVCPCTDYAAAKALATTCLATSKLDKADVSCPGMRYCTAKGLTACTATSPTAEVCDGIDNNCDGQVDENTCGSAPLCQVGVCHPANGCTYKPEPGACDDGDKCTTGDKCFDGGCAGADIDCDDNNTCTKDTCDAKTGCVHTKLDGVPCDDGEPCSLGDACKGGSCVPGPDKATLATAQGGCIDGNVCTKDLCHKKSGACINSIEEGASCDDGDACTIGDSCDKSGNCQKGATAKTCTDGKSCTTDSCDKVKGCTFKPASGACDDGDKCTQSDKCSGGGCAGTAVDCNDNNACTKDTCDAKTGCVHIKLDGVPCDDGAPCSLGDACKVGSCMPGPDKATLAAAKGGCIDGNVCTKDVCNKTSGACVNSIAAGAACDDGDACTTGDSCDTSGNCTKGTAAKTCSDGKSCTDDSCDKVKGCVFLPSATTPCGV